MDGTSHPQGDALDEAVPADGEGMTVESILREAGYTSPPDWQQIVGGKLLAAAAQAPAGAGGPRTFTVSDTEAVVEQIVRENAGRILGARPVWVRFLREAEGKGALFVISAPHPLDGADLIAVAHRGMISRGLLRDVAAWAFRAVELNRVTVRIPAARPDVQDYARRAGFVFEGVSRDLYGPGLDGQRWAMTPATCPWLPRRRRSDPVDTIPSPSSLKVH